MERLRLMLSAEGVLPDEGILDRIGAMSLEMKAGQLFMLAFGGEDPARAIAMLERHFLGGCYVGDANAGTPEKAAALSASLQSASMRATGIPLLLGVDQEGAWGVMMPRSTTGPGNLGLGAAHEPTLTRAMYRVIGEELAAVGYNTLLAPCVDVNSNPLNPIIGMRSFGARAEEVSLHAAAAVRGAAEAGVVTTVKHFPGHGNTANDSHRGIPRVDRDVGTLEKVDFAPFLAGIEAGADIVMTSHILYSALDPDMPATLSRPIVSGLLRERMKFRGVVLSDSMNMRAMRRNYRPGDAAVMALAAGVDMIMLAEEHYDHDAANYEKAQVETIDGVIGAVREGRLDEAVVDRAVYRILELKKRRLSAGGSAGARMPGMVGSAGMAVAALSPGEVGSAGLSAAALSPGMVGSTAHRAIEESVCAGLVCAIRDQAGAWPVAKDADVVLVRLAPPAAYGILTATRGIGPNQELPAFDAFRDEFVKLHHRAAVLDYWEVAGGASAGEGREAGPERAAGEATAAGGLPETGAGSGSEIRAAVGARDLERYGAILAVTEDYPLPGIDFDTGHQMEAIRRLSRDHGAKLVVIALRTPYELAEYPAVLTYVTTCSSRPCAAVAAARAAVGILPCRGISPV